MYTLRFDEKSKSDFINTIKLYTTAIGGEIESRILFIIEYNDYQSSIDFLIPDLQNIIMEYVNDECVIKYTFRRDHGFSHIYCNSDIIINYELFNVQFVLYFMSCLRYTRTFASVASGTIIPKYLSLTNMFIGTLDASRITDFMKKNDDTYTSFNDLIGIPHNDLYLHPYHYYNNDDQLRFTINIMKKIVDCITDIDL